MDFRLLYAISSLQRCKSVIFKSMAMVTTTSEHTMMLLCRQQQMKQVSYMQAESNQRWLYNRIVKRVVPQGISAVLAAAPNLTDEVPSCSIFQTHLTVPFTYSAVFMTA